MRNTLILFCLFFLSCKPATKNTRPSTPLVIQKNENAITIAFGSCSDEDKAQPLWDNIIAEGPDIWIWLGDNIYGDTQDMGKMRRKYAMQKENADYQLLSENTLITGVWDDHDFGKNDAGKEYPMRKESQAAFLDFFDVPEDSPRRNREGTYHSFVHEAQGVQVKIILLDTRYFRDKLVKVNGKNAANTRGTVLGETQWNWLEKELNNSTADYTIIASSIQAIPEEHIYEKWANFPNERDRLFNMIAQSKVAHPIILSGDRHIGEISKQEWKGTMLYDITSSSLTHGWRNPAPEANQHRIGNIVYKENYGVLVLEKEGYEVRLMSEEGVEERMELDARR